MPRQQQLGFARKPEPTVANKRDRFDELNAESARIILAAPERHGGEGSLSVVWARAFVARTQQGARQ